MSEQPRKRRLWRPSLFIFLGVVGLYLFLARPAESVNDLKVVGNLAYMVLGRAGLVIVDVSQAQQPGEIGSFDTTGHASGVAVSDQYVYIADGRAGLRIIDAGNPTAPREIGAFDSGGFSSDVVVLHDTAFVADGNPGLLIIDVGNKNSPKLLSSLKVSGNARRVVVQGKFAYLGDNQNQLRVIDVSKPLQPNEVAVLDVGDEIQDMDISETRLYLAMGSSGLTTVDITDPAQPAILSNIDTPGNLQDVAVTLGTIAFLADGENGMLVYDLSDESAVEEVGYFSNTLDANQVEVNEGGVYLSDKDSALYALDVELDLSLQRVSGTEQQQGNLQSVAVKDAYAFVTNANQGLQVIDIHNPAVPVEVASYDSPGAANGVTIAGDFIYFADGAAGLQVLTLESAAGGNLTVTEVALVDSPGEAHLAAIQGENLYLADGSGGLQIIGMANPSQPALLGSEQTPGTATGLAVLGDYAYVADGESGLRIINILDSTKPAEVGSIDTPGEARAVAVEQENGQESRILAYVADGDGGLRVIDATNPQVPIEIGAYTGYETVLDVILSGDQAYLAAGGWGFRVVDISDPGNITETGLLNTPGEAYGLATLGETVYIADNTRGMRIVDISNPAEPFEVGFYDIPRIVRNVKVAGDYAYLTDLDSGFRTADVSDPRHLKQVGHYDQGGIVEDISIQGSIAYLADSLGLQTVNISQVNQAVYLGEVTTSGKANAVYVDGELAYFTDSVSGLYIADASDPANLKLLSQHQTPGAARDVFVADQYAFIADGEAGLMIVNVADPYDPITTSLIDQFQNANSVVVSGDYAYLADGPNGLWVINISKPVAPETIAYIDTPGTALDLAISGFYLFVADGEAGLQVVNILNPGDPTLVSGIKLDGNSLNLDTEWSKGADGKPGNFFIYVAKGDRGLEIITADKDIIAVRAGLYETPGMAPISQVMEDKFPIIGRPGTEKSARTVRQTFFDIFVIGLGGLLLWLAFFAQFVLPLNSLGERKAAINRLFRYLTGSHGPAIRIENGKLIQGLGDRKRKGPGVVLLDTASAAMLRTKTAFKRAIGPGVVFTSGEEFVHQEGMDLHTQVKPLPPLGPLPVEDPFAPWNKRRETEQEFQLRQDRRQKTSGFTRDAVEIVPNILAIVKTKTLPGQGGTRFGFNPRSVQLAITREGVIPNDLRNVPWYEVPALLAVDLWREYLGKFTLIDLFSATTKIDPQTLQADGEHANHPFTPVGETGLETVLRMVNLRLTQAEVPQLDEYGQVTPGIQVSREFRILEEMGIKVKDVSISGFRFPRTVESQLVQQWMSSWLDRAITEREVVEKRRNLAGEAGREMALIDFASAVTQNISQAIVDDDGHSLPFDDSSRPDLTSSLEMLVSSTQQLLKRRTRLHQWLTSEEAAILKILEWIRR
ncbi:MAG: hypothetical protein ACWGOY_10955 [Anaerolineales bacterium]